MKLASPAVPEGLWMRLPGPFLEAPEGAVEETLALQRLEVQRWDECTLLDAGTPPELIYCIDLAQYAAEALDHMGCTPAADGRGFIARNDCQFQYQFSTPTPEQSGMMMQ